MKRMTFILLFCITSLVFVKCQTSIELPSGFAEYKNESNLFQVVSADAVRLRVYTIDNKPIANLEVLTNTTEIHFKQIGYKVLRNESITSNSGLRGRLFITSVQTMNGEFHYLTAFFPDTKFIHVVEAAGNKNTFKQYENDVIQNIKTLNPGFLN